MKIHLTGRRIEVGDSFFELFDCDLLLMNFFDLQLLQLFGLFVGYFHA